MENYPPGPATGLSQACAAFEAADTAAARWGVLSSFLKGQAFTQGGRRAAAPSGAPRQHGNTTVAKCFDMASQMPAGANGSISCGDWSGCGSGANGESWDYETCSFLVEAIGTSGSSDMFPARPWSLEWLTTHCRARFGITPAPTRLADEWGFDADGLRRQGASRILFTNGLNDGWSAGGFLEDVNKAKDLLVLNMENGAHHSDLTHTRPCPSPSDTADVLKVRAEGQEILTGWLAAAMRAGAEHL